MSGGLWSNFVASGLVRRCGLVVGCLIVCLLCVSCLVFGSLIISGLVAYVLVASGLFKAIVVKWSIGWRGKFQGLTALRFANDDLHVQRQGKSLLKIWPFADSRAHENDTGISKSAPVGEGSIKFAANYAHYLSYVRTHKTMSSRTSSTERHIAP